MTVTLFRCQTSRRTPLHGAVLAVLIGGLTTLAASTTPASAYVSYWPSQPYYDYYGPPPRAFRSAPPKRKPHAHKPAVAKEAAKKETPPKGPLIITISLEKQHLRVYDANGLYAESPVSTGMRGHSTPMGVFSVIQKQKFHRSNIYSGAPMPFMQRITWSGVALHAGVLPGYPASHGCIRMPAAFATRLYSWSRLGARVVIAPNELAPEQISHAKLMTRAESPSASNETRPAAAIAEAADAPRAPQQPKAVTLAQASSEPGAPANAATEPALSSAATAGTSEASRASQPDLELRRTTHDEPAPRSADAGPVTAAPVQVADAGPVDAGGGVVSAPSAAEPSGKLAEISPDDAVLPAGSQATAATAEGAPAATDEPVQLTATAETPVTSNPAPIATEAKDQSRHDGEMQGPVATGTTPAAASLAAPATPSMPTATADKPPASNAPASTTTAPATSVVSPPAAVASPFITPDPAVQPAPKRNGHIAVLISRKDNKLYVRQNFEPWFDVALNFGAGERPLGTHVFTAYAAETPGTFRWNVISLPAPVRQAAAKPPGRRGESVPEPMIVLPAPASPSDVLDRIEIPAEARLRLASALTPGSSIVVSDLGPGGETGLGTDFIIPLR